MGVDADSLKKSMRRWASGVTVITSTDGQERAGVTASSFTSVSVDPPLILFSLQSFTPTFKLIERTGIFAVSILTTKQANLSVQFAGFANLREGVDKFYQVDLYTAVTGAPIIADAASWMDCKLASIYEAGISRIVVGEVVATGQGEDILPLVYLNRGYYNLTKQE
jgi:3-hydroxy-9,10-secoandrosta-1,3,5(10)-triene-9,17-dione monooxygenase reductase component